MTALKRLTAAGLTTLITLAFLTPTATAAPELNPSGRLTVSVSVSGGPAKTVSLTCDPDGGTHPTPQKACDQLRSVSGDPAQLAPDRDRVCTQEHQPHQVTMTGSWLGQSVSYKKTFGNRCEMASATGDLFAI